jgi:putative hemolysin
MTAGSWGELALLIVCTAVACVASGAETALTSVGRFRVQHLAEEGSRAARILQRVHEDPNRFMSTVLVVNTVALIMASYATTLLAVRYVPARYGFWGPLAVALGLSLLVLIFAEVTPKSLAIRHAERIALLVAPGVAWLSRPLRPLIWFITIVARAVTGGRAARAPYLTEEELMSMLSVSEIEEDEREMITGIIEIGDKAVREVMVPRTDIVAVSVDTGLEDVLRVAQRSGHTRIPAYEKGLDDIVGLLYVKDLMPALLQEPRPPFDVRKVMRKAVYTPESKKVDELLHQMQAQRVHMMIVVDEYGGTAGLVTLEDLLEEIVGEIRDEYDVAEEEQLRITGDRTAVVDARFPMAELNERLALGVPESGDYDSVGGYVLATLGRFPEQGTAIDGGRVRWTVEAVDRFRVLRVRLEAGRGAGRRRASGAGVAGPARRIRRRRGGLRGIATYRGEALVLRKVDYGETDRIYTLLMREQGKVGVIARGVRRPTSRLGPALELFGRIDVQLARGHNLDVVTQVVRLPGPRMTVDVERTAYAGLIAEVADRVCEERSPAPEVYDVAALALHDLAVEPDPRRASAWFCARALDVLGYTPRLGDCASCGRPLPPEPAPFAPDAGGLLCPDCARPGMAPISVAAIKVLRVAAAGDGELYGRLRLEGGVLGEVEGALEAQLEHHLDRQLRSLRFLRQMRSPESGLRAK